MPGKITFRRKFNPNNEPLGEDSGSNPVSPVQDSADNVVVDDDDSGKIALAGGSDNVALVQESCDNLPTAEDSANMPPVEDSANSPLVDDSANSPLVEDSAETPLVEDSLVWKKSEEIYTDDDKEYRIRPVKGKGQGRDTLTFDVRCNNDAHIALLSGDAVGAPMIEVFIGGWSNSKSAIRLNQTKPDKEVVETPDIVCMDEFRRFWIQFKNNNIQVGKEGEEAPFLAWTNSEDPFKVTHFAFSTGWGSDGYWMFDDEENSSSSSSSSSSEEEDPEKIRQRGKKPFYRRPGVWLDAKEGQVPLRAVIGGVDSSGEKIYIGRAKFEGGLLPGKIVPSHGVCYVSHQGGEHAVPKYQVLVKNKCCDLTWVPAAHGEIPNGALQGGFSPEKEPVYIARAMYDGATAVGMVHPGRGLCSVPYGGEELCVAEYEVLVVKCIPL